MNNLDKFDKLCTQIYYWKGEFRFPFEGIQYDGRFSNIVNDSEYKIYESKMVNLIKLLNKDMSQLNMETEELWEVI